MGPLLLSRMLSLNDVQEGVLNVAFRAADEAGLLLLDLKDLRAVLTYCTDHADELQREYGNVSAASIGTIQRELLTLESQGGDKLFGEPALDLNDIMRTDINGRGVISLLAADQLMQSPQVYATMLLWLLSELFEHLPEVGDLEKPKLVFFFDEAHLLFTDAPSALLQKIEQVVRLIRSKGVGIYFVTQNPTDIPDTVLGQLGNKVQHAIRAFTPKDQKAVDAMAQTFRPNPSVDVATVVTQLNVGEALVSVLDQTGSPTPVERAWVVPPHAHIGAITPEQRAAVRAGSPVGTKYDQTVEREGAFEKLNAQGAAATAAATAAPAAPQGSYPSGVPAPGATAATQAPPPQQGGGAGEAAAAIAGVAGGLLGAFGKSALRSFGTQMGREISRGLLGGMTGSSRRR
jgi:DNA helicase HerA-like ATPase